MAIKKGKSFFQNFGGNEVSNPEAVRDSKACITSFTNHTCKESDGVQVFNEPTPFESQEKKEEDETKDES